MYDCIVIGAGIAGCTAARKLAEDKNRKVLLIEERAHVAGNCYDRADEYGVLIHVYGPHIFHTNDEKVYAFLSRFTDWNLFGHEVVAEVYGKQIPVPFNLNTLHMVYEKEKADALEQKLIAAYGMGSRVPIMVLRESEDTQIKAIADYVYENVFLHYTMKQWGQTPEEISPEVTGRVPVLISYDNRYFQDKYQGMPINGYTSMFEKMLDHPNITVKMGKAAKTCMEFLEDKILYNGKEYAGDVIYTGALDELYDCRFGRLPYRSLDFQFEHFEKDSYQGRSVVNYTVSEAYTRITEFKYLTRQKDTKGTTIVKEYPFAYEGKAGEIPYYAIINNENQKLYRQYEELTWSLKRMHLLGRLAEYKYYNIDAITKKALLLAEDMGALEKS